MKPYPMTNHIIVTVMLPQANAAAVPADILELGLPNVSSSSLALLANTCTAVKESAQEPSASSQTQPALVHFFSLALPAQGASSAEVHLPSAKRHPALKKGEVVTCQDYILLVFWF